MNRIAWVIAIGYASLALISAVMYVTSTVKFVDNSETQFRFRAPTLENVTFTPIAGGWNISLRWRAADPGRLPVRIAIFEWEVTIDNGTDSRSPLDPAKLGDEYHIRLGINLDRFTGPVVAAGGSRTLPWWVDQTDPVNVWKIARNPSDGRFTVVVTDGVVIYYVGDINERHTAYVRIMTIVRT